MKKRWAIATGLLLTLGTAVSATMSNETAVAIPTATVESMSADVGSRESAQIVAMWEAHASSAASVPLPRPL